MGVMATFAGIIAFHVEEAGVIRHTFILIATLHLRAILCGSRCIIVDVYEGEVFIGYIILAGQAGILDGLVNLDFGSAPLVALHAAGFITQPGKLDTGWEYNMLGSVPA